VPDERPRLLRLAHGDAWQVLGRVHEPHGGGVAELLDVAAVRAWYADRDVPWGARVPAGAAWRTGRYLFCKALSGLVASSFTPAPAVPGLVVSPAGPEDLEEVVRIDGEAFGGDAAPTRRWLAPLVTGPAATVVLARLHGRPVGTAYTVRSDGAAGPAAYLGGVGVVTGARPAARVHERLGFEVAAALDVYVDLA
jgi:hypothetical protein